jgi:anti-anti-sigma regulatory factor
VPQVSALPTIVLRLVPPMGEQSLSELRTRATDAAKRGRRALIDIDMVPVLDSPIIACLISTLRDIREVGGEMAIGVARPNLLMTLKVTGLEKVFTLVEPPLEAAEPPAPPAPAPRPRRKSRLATASLLALGLAAGLAGSSSAEPLPTPESIVQRVEESNPTLRSYQAQVHVQVDMQSFPFLAPHLEGTTYYKRPGNYEVVFQHVPSYARGFNKLYSDAGDPLSWERRFNISVVGEREVAGHPDVILRMVQKVRGMIDHQDVAIDESAWRVDEMEWHYYNGGVITMTQGYESSGDWSILASQHAVIHIPYVRAVADARYDGYRTNVAIDDQVFTKKSK